MILNKISLPSLLFFACLAGGMFSPNGELLAAKPNVVFILADDLGWSDTTLFGTTKFYKTPNIERLAARGMTFTRAYSSSPLCSPTRASILTGLSPARTGITTPNCHLPKVILAAEATATGPPHLKATSPNSVSRLKSSYYTLAEMFKDNGYATAHFGKWHLGSAPYSPLEHGFDIDVPHWAGPGPAGSYVAPWRYPDFDPQTPDEHIEDRMASEAVTFMEQNQGQPFFLNYWMFSVHAPFDAKQALIDRYAKQIDPKDPQRSPTYAAMIESMDDAVGTLLDTLDRLKIADNTIIIFASDNGGNMYNQVDGTTATSNAPLRGGKATMYEGGVRGPAIVVQPGVVAANSRSDEVIQSSDFYPTLLEMLSIEKQPDQKFDGISITPALQGGSLDRDAIFTYFPHSPPIPEWMPPAVSVHQNDWKLIRIFHSGEAGKHRYKLFHLAEDIGEQHDLSAKHPERVQQMDALIEAFLVDTNAVRPQPNRRFDPAKYRPDLEGIGNLKNSAARSAKKPAKPRGKPVAGWQPDGTCTLKRDGDALVLTSDGGDPYIIYVLPNTIPNQPLILRFAMRSNSSGRGQVFWREQAVRPPFLAARSVKFEPEHDDAVHEYTVEFTAGSPIDAVRIDPSTAAGKIRISNIRLTDRAGNVLHHFTP
ncbi:sulfatase [Rosistilla oblonga]|uniref:Arylsulfatase n=1 Tax=Rosistilla oblonga TaxID=2527990 RepID=A0A518IPZ6_9BACT|nr:sulfatase [Rosistilla oblonga]QDV55154.1 Arylsulfatase precursor [Rosistilla oblonga]